MGGALTQCLFVPAPTVGLFELQAIGTWRHPGQGELLVEILLVAAQGGLLKGGQPGHDVADRSHDADDRCRHIMALGAEPVIPGRCHRREPIDHDRALYRERNIVECSIGWLKQGRHIATCYEKTAASGLGFVLFAAARHWLRNP